MDASRFGVKLSEMRWSQCAYCRHLQPGGTCPAFPAGIPDAIKLNLHDHRQSYPGDGDIRMEPLTDGYEFGSWAHLFPQGPT